jgi:hypothetical protein
VAHQIKIVGRERDSSVGPWMARKKHYLNETERENHEEQLTYQTGCHDLPELLRIDTDILEWLRRKADHRED